MFFKLPFCIKVESLEKGSPSKSLYAKATDTGVDPQAAKRLNIDWDSAVDIDPEEEDGDDIDVPPAVVNILDLSLSRIHIYKSLMSLRMVILVVFFLRKTSQITAFLFLF